MIGADKNNSKYRHLYVWMDPVNDTFSDSWTEETHKSCGGTDHVLALNNPSSEFTKLIKYECLNDDGFKLCRHMKLK